MPCQRGSLLTDGTHKFVWGANGLAYNLTLGSSPTVETYHADQIGSIREITNSDGSVHTTYLTDEYGNRTTVKGTDDQPFQYTGEQVDAETGFVYLRARYYDSQTGRFISHDRWPGTVQAPEGFHKFAYTGNNPINLTDPSGFDPWSDLQDWLESNLLRPLAAPAFSDAPEGQPGDLSDLVSEGEVSGTGRALPGLEAATDIISVAGLAVPGGGEVDAAANGPRIAGILEGFTRHGLNQVITRGVRPYEILDALQNPIRVVQRANGTIQYVGQWADLRLNQARQLVTAIRFKAPWQP